MGKKVKRLKEGMNSLGGAYLRALVALAEQRTRHDATVDAMAWQIKRLAEERDAARADVETLTQANAEADSTIGALRKELEVLGGVASMFERDLAALQAQHSAVSDALDLEREHSAMTISKLRDNYAELERNAAAQVANLEREMLTQRQQDAAIIEQMRKDWSGDVTAAQEVIERKNAEIVELKRDLATVRAERDEAVDALKNAQAPVICSRCGRDVLAKDDTMPDEPVVTLQAIQELDEGERLIDDDSMMIIEMSNSVYLIYGTDESVSGIPAKTPQEALKLYQGIRRGVKP